jgi:uncharacterized protein YjbJ (UPF0337 family)
METSKIERNWKKLKSSVKEEWNELTDEELNKMEGKWERMVDTIALKYALTKMEAEDQLNQWKIKAKNMLD